MKKKMVLKSGLVLGAALLSVSLFSAAAGEQSAARDEVNYELLAQAEKGEFPEFLTTGSGYASDTHVWDDRGEFRYELENGSYILLENIVSGSGKSVMPEPDEEYLCTGYSSQFIKVVNNGSEPLIIAEGDFQYVVDGRTYNALSEMQTEIEGVKRERPFPITVEPGSEQVLSLLFESEITGIMFSYDAPWEVRENYRYHADYTYKGNVMQENVKGNKTASCVSMVGSARPKV